LPLRFVFPQDAAVAAAQAKFSELGYNPPTLFVFFRVHFGIDHSKKLNQAIQKH